MNKSILITENKIIKEDNGALDAASKSLDLGKSVNFIKNIAAGVLNITKATITDLVKGAELLLTYGISGIFDQSFNDALESGQNKRNSLNSEWESLKNKLDIDRPVQDFLNITTPSIGIANSYINQQMNKSYFSNNSFLKTLISPAKSFYSISNSLFKEISGKSKTPNSVLNIKSGFEKYYKWYEKLSDSEIEKINKWTYENQSDSKKALNLLQKNKPDEVINFFKNKVLVESKSFLINNNSLILEQEKNMPKDFEVFYRRFYIQSLIKEYMAHLIDEEIKYSSDMEKLKEEYEKVLDENKDIIEEKLKENTKTN